MSSRFRLFSAFLLLTSPQAASQDVVSVEPFAIGETVTFRSAVLDEDRTLNVYLPHGFSRESSKTYPVIYLLDGSVDEDFIHVAGIAQFGSFSWIGMIPESIVVGIANVDRKRDFTFPAKNEEDRAELPTSGGSARFIRFLEKELQPFVERRYPTRAERTLIGQSLGGLLATEVLFTRPGLFDHYIIVSPSLWWNDESLLKAAPKEIDAGTSIYVGVGKEGAVMERLARTLHDRLASTGHPPARLHFQFLQEQDHGDALHLAVYDAFEKIFAGGRD